MRRSAAFLIPLSAALVIVPSAGAWTAAESLTPLSGTGTAQGVSIGMSPGGDATAIWGYASDYRNTSYAINASNHAVGDNSGFDGGPVWKGDTFISAGTSTVVPQETSNGQPRMSIGVGPGGSVMAAWSTKTGGNSGLVAAASRGATGEPFGAATLLTPLDPPCPNPPIDPSAPVVSIDAKGAGHVSWFGKCVSNLFPQPALFTQAFSPAGLATNPLTTESNGAAVSSEGGGRISPQVAEAIGGGSAVAAFAHDTSGPNGSGVAYDRLTSSVSDQRVTDQKYVGHAAGATGVRVAALPNGGVLVAWIIGGVIHVSVDGGPDTVIPTPGQAALAQNFVLSAGADGTAVLAWVDSNGGAVWGAVRSPDGAAGAPAPGQFGPAHQLSATDGQPNHVRTAVSANGIGYAVWTRDTGAFDGVEGSIVDPLDPARSPGTPWQFQPVADTLVNGGFAPGLLAGGALAPAIAVDAAGDADVIAPVEVPHTDSSGSTSPRYAIAMVENRATRPAPAPTPGPAPADTPAPAPAPADTPTPTAAPTAPTGATPPPTVAPAPPKPTLVISGFQLTRRYFAPGKKEGKKVSGPHDETLLGNKPPQGLRVGTQINFTLTQAATVHVRVAVSGCFDTKLSKKAPASTKHCTAKGPKVGTVIAELSFAGKKGANSIPFTDGNLTKKNKLIVGTLYSVELTGLDAGTGQVVRPLASAAYVANVDGPLPG